MPDDYFSSSDWLGWIRARAARLLEWDAVLGLVVIAAVVAIVVAIIL